MRSALTRLHPRQLCRAIKKSFPLSVLPALPARPWSMLAQWSLAPPGAELVCTTPPRRIHTIVRIDGRRDGAKLNVPPVSDLLLPRPG